MNLDATVRRYRGCARAILLITAVMAGFGPVAHGQPPQRDIVLMLDNSGSMRKNDPDFLTSVAVRAFIEGLDEDYHVAIISFDQQVKVLKPLAALDAAHRAALLASLDSINYRGLLTNSPAGLERSLYELRTNGRAGAEKSIIFMTDGIVDVAPEGADEGDVEKARWMKSTLADTAAENAVRIFGIAFTDNADFELIQTLARRTEGQYYRAYTAADIDGVFSSIRDRISGTAPEAAPTQAVNRYIPEPASAATPGADAAPDADTTGAAQTVEENIASMEGRASETADGSSSESDIPLPASDASATLPIVSLPDGELPTVSLPVVNLGGDSTPATDPTPPEQVSAETPATTAHDGADQSAVADAVAAADSDNKQQASNSTATPAPIANTMPAPMDDSKFYLALMVGAAAIVLALAALVFVLMRRKPAAATAADALMPKAFLNDIAGITEKQSYEVGAKPIVIGRLRGTDSEAADYIVIDETTIGRRHALIEYKEHSFWVTDQNSLNGTFVNNARLDTGVRLKHGDRIRFHKHEFEFLVLDMFETDRTMMSATEFSDVSASSPDDGDDDATLVRIDDDDSEPSADDPTIRR